MWEISHRADIPARLIADRHYNRQKVGSPQFVPPGRCLVLKRHDALWVTSYPFAEYVRHAWAGAFVNSLFRNESDDIASDMIREAVAATLAKWPSPPLGMITFVDAKKVKPTKVRGKNVFGWSYGKAGFEHVGFTKGGLWAWQLKPENMPEPKTAFGQEYDL